MTCKECNSYLPSEKLAGGRCPHLGGEAKFPESACSAKIWQDKGAHTELKSLFSPKAKPKVESIPEEQGLGEDPQETYK